MKFEEVLPLMKEGNKAFRLGWNNPNIYIAVQIPDENSNMTMPYIYMGKYNNKFPCDLSCESFFAEDWEIIR